MAVIKDRPMSPSQEQALAALMQYGYIAEPAGTWANLPYSAMVSRRTRDALLRRGIGKSGHLIVGAGRIHWEAVVSKNGPDVVDVPMPAPVPAPSTADLATLNYQGYVVSVYRSPNTGDIVFDLETPEGVSVSVLLNNVDLHER